MSGSGATFRFDGAQVASNLHKVANGVWMAKGHTDLGFLSDDETDWEAIEPHSFWHHHRNEVFLELLRQYPPTGDAVIFEIGAGAGSVTKAIQDAGYDVVGIEPTDASALRAQKREVKNLIRATVENAQFHDGALSNIGMFDVLEHIPEDGEYLKTLRQLIPTGGRYYCAVPAWRFLWSEEDDTADHIRRYTLSEMITKLEEAGFEVEMVSYYFLILFLPILLLRALPSRLGLRKKRTHEQTTREHILEPGFKKSFIDAALSWEFKRLSKGRAIPFGASVVAVARAI